MHCDFVTQLARLRKLSSDSVDNAESFSDLNRYMHVTRVVEDELKDLLRKVKGRNEKTLILLCGSAGDGKSHLLSFLKNEDPEGLLDGIEIYNDATESAAPHLTAIDTLADRLQEFNDQNLGNEGTKKLILAINLGVLNNFIESEKGANFSRLKAYVESSEIFSSFIKRYEYREGSPFQHVSFSDFHLYTLKDGEIRTEYLNQLFEKVFDQTDANPFYRCYKDQESSCTHCSECPVKHNYELLFNSTIRESIINQLVEVSIKDKVVITTREILNFIYDILVHPSFSEKNFFKGRSDTKDRLENYLDYTTPILAYEQADVSQLLNSVRNHDFLKYRTAELDEFSLRFHTSIDVKPFFERSAKETPYISYKELTEHFDQFTSPSKMKEKLYRFVVRLNDLKQELDSIDNNGDFKEFIRYLYDQNKGNAHALSPLYSVVTSATLKWNGDFGAFKICLDDLYDHYWLVEDIRLKRLSVNDQKIGDDELFRFSPTLKVAFCSADNTKDTVELVIDFSLFKLIKSMNRGYRLSIEDKNAHPNFISFIHQVIELGRKSEDIEIISKDNPKQKFSLSENMGYEFRKC